MTQLPHFEAPHPHPLRLPTVRTLDEAHSAIHLVCVVKGQPESYCARPMGELIEEWLPKMRKLVSHTRKIGILVVSKFHMDMYSSRNH